MNKSGRMKIVLIMVLVLLVFLVVFYFAANRKQEDNLVRLSATEATIQRDLSINYPQTPKAVVRYYAELSQCMYDPGNSEEEVEAIAGQSRQLLDDELKSQQTDEEYLKSLKSAIALFLQDNRRIVSFTVSPSTEVVYKTLDIGDVASLYCTYTMQKGTVSYSDSEHFLLRKNSEGQWKILGWQSVEKERVNAAEVPSAVEKTVEKEPDTKDGAKGSMDLKLPTVEVPTVEIEVPGVK